MVTVMVKVRVRVRVRGDSCPMNQSQNAMAYAIRYIPFHCGAEYNELIP